MDITSYSGAYFMKKNNHIYIRPAKELCDMIAHYTITFASSKPVECEQYHILPDASGCFIFQENDEIRQDFWGPMTEIVVLKNDLNDVPERFFVEFLAGGLYQVCGHDQKAFVNMRDALACLDRTIDEQLLQLYKASHSYDELIEKLNAYFIKQRKQFVLHERCKRILGYMKESKGCITIKEIAEREQMSTRQLHRDFERYIGVSLKEYASIVRFHHTLDLMEQDDLINAALQGGYFDQSHFNKVFKNITNTSPKKYLTNLSDFYKEIYKF